MEREGDFFVPSVVGFDDHRDLRVIVIDALIIDELGTLEGGVARGEKCGEIFWGGVASADVGG